MIFKNYKALLTIIVACFIVSAGFAQEEEGEKFNLKKRGLKIRENIGKQLLKVMTAKSDDLAQIKATAYYVSGVFPTYTEVSGMDFYPDDLNEGDHILGLNLMKNDGVGVIELEGEITYDGQPLLYLGGGGYLIEIDPKDHSPKTLVMKSNSGQTVNITLEYIPEIEIDKVNGEESLPLIDVEEDLTFEYSPKHDDDLSELRLAFLTDVAGARTWNYFETVKEREGEIRIPKESLATTEISSSLGGVNFLQGNNFFLVERRRYKEAKEIGDIGPLADLRIESVSYKAMPVIVQGKAKKEEGNFMMMRQGLIFDQGELEIEMTKPNAEYGIPLKAGSNFGLSRLSLTGSNLEGTSRQATRYVSLLSNSGLLTKVKSDFTFPDLPQEHYDAFLEKFYQEFKAAMLKEFNVTFSDVEALTSAGLYQSMPTESMPANAFKNDQYKSTKWVKPSELADVFNAEAAKQATEKPDLNLMRNNNIDGLVNLHIDFKLAEDQNGDIMLIPEVLMSITGRDENGAPKEVVYGTVAVRAFHGVPLDAEKLQSSPDELYHYLRGDEMVYGLKFGLIRIQQKERELGFEKIWKMN